MPCEILVVNVPKDPYLRGEPVIIKDQPATWGAKEGLPNWGKLIITDKTKEQVENYLAPLRSVFEYTVLGQNAQGKRIRIEIEPKIVEIFGAGKGMRQELYEWLQEVYQAENVPAQSNPPYSYVLDFPDPDLDLQQLKLEFEDEAVDSLAPHRYHFSETDMDILVASGGVLSLTGNQAATRIIDRLA